MIIDLCWMRKSYILLEKDVCHERGMKIFAFVVVYSMLRILRGGDAVRFHLGSCFLATCPGVVVWTICHFLEMYIMRIDN